MIVVFDSNIWISALEFGGQPYQAILRALSEEQVAVSNVITSEIVRVLVTKFQRDRSWILVRLDELLKDALPVEISGEIHGTCRDSKDDAILETAWKAHADLLVSGDKDLLSMRTFRGIRIVSPAAYLRLA